MVLKLLGENEVVKIYEEKMPEDFAKGEIKPLARILELSRQGKYTVTGFMTGRYLPGIVFWWFQGSGTPFCWITLPFPKNCGGRA